MHLIEMCVQVEAEANEFKGLEGYLRPCGEPTGESKEVTTVVVSWKKGL